jgi:hypothetical protein
MALFGLTGSKTKNKFSKNTSETSQEIIDPRIQQYGYDTMNMFDRLSGGVLGRYGNQAATGQPGLDFNAPTLDRAAVTGPASFIPDFSTDTSNAFGQVRGFQGSGAQLRALAAGINPASIAAIGAPGQIGAIGDPGQIGSIAAEQQGDIERGSASTALDYLSQYLNDPSAQNLIDASLKDFDVGVDRSANAMRARRDAGTAFGSGAAISDAVFNADAARGRGSLGAQIRFDQYGRALNAAAGDAGRFTSASMANAAAANAQAANNAQLRQGANVANADIAGRNIANRLNLGGMNADIAGRNIDNQFRTDQANLDNQLRAAGLSADMLTGADQADLAKMNALLQTGQMQDQQNLARAQEPLDLLKMRLALLAGIPYGTTTNTTGTASGKSSGTSLGFSISGNPLGP